ncbi:MAG: hypothetical protein AAF721_39980 [Myxococcota bacterium]
MKGRIVLGVLSVACVPKDSAPVAGPPEEHSQPDNAPIGPAFVLITEQQTTVLPVEPSSPAIARAGIWVQLPGKHGPRIGGLFETRFVAAPAADATLPLCARGTPSDSCFVADGTAMFGYVHATAPGRLQWSAAPRDFGGCECLVVEGLSTDPSTEDEPPDPCRGDGGRAASPRPAAVVGDVLYRAGIWTNEGCSDAPVTDAVSDIVPILPGGRALEPPERREPPLCRATQTIEVDWGPGDKAACRLGDDRCKAFCYHDDEAQAFALRRGALAHVTGSASVEGGVCTCSAAQRVAPDACPSPVDACGDPAAFEAAADAHAFWVANGDAFALVGDASHLDLHDVSGRVRGVDVPAPILGVHFVDDATPLRDLAFTVPATLGPAWPAGDAADAEFSGDAEQWRDRCEAHLGAERLDAAESACLHGLQSASRGRRASLTDLLGRIAVARGHGSRAAEYFERSLALSPDPAVEARLRQAQTR